MLENVGFVGLGHMGNPMARRLIETGYPLAVHDLRPEVARPLVELGARETSTPREAAIGADVFITMVTDSDAVDACVLGPDGALAGLRPGSVLVDMSTSYPPRTRQLAAVAEAAGVAMLDAPVSGGVVGAEQGSLSIMVGGDYATFQRLEALLRVMGKNIYHMGPTGAGHTMKLVNNFLSATTLLATGEALMIAAKGGLDPARANEILQKSTGRSYSTDWKIPRFVLTGSYDSGFSMRLHVKDLSLLVKLGNELGAPTLVSSLVQQLFALGLVEVGPSADNSEIIKMLEKWAGTTLAATTEALAARPSSS